MLTSTGGNPPLPITVTTLKENLEWMNSAINR